jgi:hypothetical protein
MPWAQAVLLARPVDQVLQQRLVDNPAPGLLGILPPPEQPEEDESWEKSQQP